MPSPTTRFLRPPPPEEPVVRLKVVLFEVGESEAGGTEAKLREGRSFWAETFQVLPNWFLRRWMFRRLAGQLPRSSVGIQQESNYTKFGYK